MSDLESELKQQVVQFLGDAIYVSEPVVRGEALRFMLVNAPYSTMEDYGLTEGQIELIMDLNEDQVSAKMTAEIEKSRILGGKGKKSDGWTEPGRSLVQFFSDVVFETPAPIRGDALRVALAADPKAAMYRYGLVEKQIAWIDGKKPSDVMTEIKDALPGGYWFKSRELQLQLRAPWPGAQIKIHGASQRQGKNGFARFEITGLGFHRDLSRLAVEFQRDHERIPGVARFLRTTVRLQQEIIVEARLEDEGKYSVAVGDRYSKEWDSYFVDYVA
jgi:hypothetical protein